MRSSMTSSFPWIRGKNVVDRGPYLDGRLGSKRSRPKALGNVD